MKRPRPASPLAWLFIYIQDDLRRAVEQYAESGLFGRPGKVPFEVVAKACRNLTDAIATIPVGAQTAERDAQKALERTVDLWRGHSVDERARALFEAHMDRLSADLEATP